MKYIALVRSKDTKQTEILEMDYPSKKAFKKDIRGNGLVLVHNFVYTPEEWQKMINEDREFTSWMEYRIEMKKVRSRISRRIRKERKASR